MDSPCVHIFHMIIKISQERNKTRIYMHILVFLIFEPEQERLYEGNVKEVNEIEKEK